MIPGNSAVDEVLTWPPERLLRWVEEHIGAIACTDDWQTIAYGCGLEVTVKGTGNEQDVDAWASAGVLIYDRLGTVCGDSLGKLRAVDSAMSLRAYMIDKFGSQPSHPVRDPAVLENWFFDRLGFSYDEAVDASKRSLSLSTADFLRISALKDRIRLMKSIRSQSSFSRHRELDLWYGLVDTTSK